MQNDHSKSASGQSLAVRIADSAMVIAAAGAALYFAGWTYRQTYYLHFGIDPASLTVSNIAIAVSLYKGGGGKLTTLTHRAITPLQAVDGTAVIAR